MKTKMCYLNYIKLHKCIYICYDDCIQHKIQKAKVRLHEKILFV